MNQHGVLLAFMGQLAVNPLCPYSPCNLVGAISDLEHEYRARGSLDGDSSPISRSSRTSGPTRIAIFVIQDLSFRAPTSERSAGSRRSPQEHAGVGAIRQEKTPTENGWGFVIGGGTRNRTRVRNPSQIVTPPPWGRGFDDLATVTVLNPNRTPANPSQTKESRHLLVWQMFPSAA